MRHGQVIDLLPAFTDGSLPTATRNRVASHVERCLACVSWIDDYQALRALVGNSEATPHPDSGILAICASRPEELFEPGREELREHLAGCQDCTLELGLLQAAVAQARPATVALTPPTSRVEPKVPTPWRKLAAAAMAACVLGPLAFLGSKAWSGDPLETLEVAVAVRPVPVSSQVGDFSLGAERIHGFDVEGIETFQSDGNLAISQLKVRDGATLTIQSGETVVFGDGFQVGSGAKLSVGAGLNRRVEKGRT
jgi:hypothetical protein